MSWLARALGLEFHIDITPHSFELRDTALPRSAAASGKPAPERLGCADLVLPPHGRGKLVLTGTCPRTGSADVGGG